MAHVTGNAAWVDYPSTATLVTAAKLEAIENSSDALYTSEYGSLTRTRAPMFRARYTGGGYTQGASDTFWGSTGVTVDQDTDTGYSATGSVNYTIPVSGRLWEVYFRLCTGTLGSGAVLVAAVTITTATVATSIIRDSSIATGGECHAVAHRPAIPMNAGDKLYVAGWCSTSCTIAPIFGFTYPEWVVRDVGPQ